MVHLRPWLRGARRVSGHMAMVGVLLASLVLLLGACGGSSHGSAVGPPAPTTSVTGFCPNGRTSQAIAAPAVIVTPNTPGHSATAHVGQTVVVELPATQMQWSTRGATPPGILMPVQPSNALDAAIGQCFWTYQVTSSGTARLTYIGTLHCNPTQPCPQGQPPAGATPSPVTSSGGAEPSHALQIVFTINAT